MRQLFYDTISTARGTGTVNLVSRHSPRHAPEPHKHAASVLTLAGLCLLSCGIVPTAQLAGQEPEETPVWFTGATLIVGDGSTPISGAVFVVENGKFTSVGAAENQPPPAGARLVTLTGLTVIPALIDAHQHIGLTDVRRGSHSQSNYTRENLIEHLERSAYHGVAATMSLGLEADETLALELRALVRPDTARFLTSGRGIAANPTAGPQQDYRLGIPRGAQTAAAGRAAVQQLDARGVTIVKIWVDDRRGTVPKLGPPVYRAIIDEAHSRGMQVVAHIGTSSALQDAKDLLRAGIDGFAHTVRDRDIDPEYMALVRSYPDVWTIPNLPGSPVTSEDLPWLRETLPASAVNALARDIAQRGSEPDDQFQLQCQNLRRNREAEMVIGMGTDSGTSVAWTTHIELRDMVSCGLSPMEAIVAATHTNARILGLDEQLGTVAVGKNASFIVLDGEPLTDINHTRRIVDVYLDGNRVDRENLRTKFMAGTLP
jgi:imidazolonepropionase-like amidohydrolase